MTLGQLKLILSQRRLRPNKKLGQNFLYDPNMIARILRSIAVSREETVVEVGPGPGALTEGLLQSAGEVWGVELDKGFSEYLKERFSDLRNFHLVHGDILRWALPPQSALSPLGGEGEGEGKFVLAGNLPYQISSPFLEWLVQNRHRISRAFITVQLEFAKRMTAQLGAHEGSSLSCFVQMYAKPEILFKIPRTVFYPSPEVDSAFVKLVFLEEPAIPVKDERVFREFIRKGFSHRRKTLANALHQELGIPREEIVHLLAGLRVVPDIRAERLTLQQWAWLSDRLLDRIEKT